MKLNSPLPYKVEKKDDRYYFITISGVIYTAYFIEINFISGVNLYSFSFETDGERPRYDERISITIINILHKFFQNNSNALIFVCETDGQERCRMRLFDSWFMKHSEKEELVKIDTEESFPDYSLIASIIMHKENPQVEAIPALLNEYIDTMRY